VRTYILGDRWQGDVSISGNSIRVVTDSSLGGHGVGSVTIDARKPCGVGRRQINAGQKTSGSFPT
jgi:hypothetical protein